MCRFSGNNDDERVGSKRTLDKSSSACITQKTNMLNSLLGNKGFSIMVFIWLAAVLLLDEESVLKNSDEIRHTIECVNNTILIKVGWLGYDGTTV